QYQQARQIKANMVIVIERLLSFVVNTKNVYGYKLERQTVKDTILATSSIYSYTYPDTGKVYQLINSVKKYVKDQNGIQVNNPMLNISKDPSGRYQAMVAIPINEDIKPDKNIVINHMVAGNILVAEIKGGPNRIAEGFKQMKTYMKDFKLVSPAMPFESLVTDRSSEPDTSKWITRIYYPIL
ncbi:MAG TPA: GyrI-like domain-containing protein, partial [Daejeonella sp.]|nr:GyrI-like domain-containing protein [Daejeonella sp.]